MKATYEIDPAHSAVLFSVRHLMIANARGAFRITKGTVVYDPADLGQSSITASIDANTLDTRDEKRDGHVKSKDFLDVEQFPTFEFVSTAVTSAGEGQLNVTGNLTMRGVTNEVVLRVTGPTAEGKDPWGNAKVGAEASTVIKRSAYGLVWNAPLETGGVLIGDDVKIELELELTKSQAA